MMMRACWRPRLARRRRGHRGHLVERDDLASLAGFFAGDAAAGRAAASLARRGRGASHARAPARRRRSRLSRGRRWGAGRRIRSSGCPGRTRDVVDRRRRSVRPAAAGAPRRSSRRPRPHALVRGEVRRSSVRRRWRPVLWNRSRSVSPRGEGAAFAEKVQARMTSALVQSHSPWLPNVSAEAGLERAIGDLPSDGTRLVLDVAGEPDCGRRARSTSNDRGRTRRRNRAVEELALLRACWLPVRLPGRERSAVRDRRGRRARYRAERARGSTEKTNG